MIRIIVVGALGKMGQTLFEAIEARAAEFCAVAGVDPCAHEGTRSHGVNVYPSIDMVTETADCIIDFSRPEALSAELPYAAKHGIFLIVGTTALTPEHRAMLDKYALLVPIFASGNLSLGVNLQLQLVKRAAATLGDKYETEIIEKHHHFKVDSPSGTAIMLADAINSQHPDGLKYTYGRYTRTERRRPDELGIHSIRGGTIVGEHEVMFIGEDEIVEINHKAYSKRIFTQGALRAAQFMMDKQPGLYDMQDIVLENDVLSHLYATDEQCILRLSGISVGDIRGVFAAIAARGVFVDMISMDAPGTLAFTVPMKSMFLAEDEVRAYFLERGKDPTIKVIPNITKVVVEGIGMEFRHGVAAEIFNALADAKVELLMVTTSETKVACAIDSQDAGRGLNALAEYLDL